MLLAYRDWLGELMAQPLIKPAESAEMEHVRTMLEIDEATHKEAVGRLGLTVEDLDRKMARGQGVEHYFKVLQSILENHGLDKTEHEMLMKLRQEENVSEGDHILALKKVGWSEEDYTNAADGQQRAAALEFKEMLGQMQGDQAETGGEDEAGAQEGDDPQAALERFAAKNRIVDREVDWALDELGIDKDHFDAQRLRAMKSNISRLEVNTKDIDRQLELWQQKLDSTSARTKSNGDRLKELELSGKNVQTDGEKMEQRVETLRTQIDNHEAKLKVARQSYNTKKEKMEATNAQCSEVEETAEKRRGELEALRLHVMSLSAHLGKANDDMREQEKNWVAVNLQAKELIEIARGPSEKELKQMRLFRTSVVAIIARINVVNSNEPPPRVVMDVENVDLVSLYKQAVHHELNVYEWNQFITHHINTLHSERRAAYASPSSGLAGLCVARR